jgi:hypothetical protein
MADPTETIEGPAVAWRFDAPQLSLSRFAELMTELGALLRDIQSEVVPGGGVQWIVETISKSSPLALSVTPVAQKTRVPKARLRACSTTVTNGLRQIQRKPVRPANFSDQALKRAHKIVTMTRSQSARIQVGAQELDAQFIANVEKILGDTIRSIGTVEGTLEGINVHGQNRSFAVYDPLTGERIACDFAHRIGSDEVGRAIEKRVAVHGEIIYRDSGEIVRIAAQSIEVFPFEEDLPTADDVRGILA